MRTVAKRRSPEALAARAVEALSHDAAISPGQKEVLAKALPAIEAFARGGSKTDLRGALAESDAFSKRDVSAVVKKLEKLLAGVDPSTVISSALTTLAGAQEVHAYMFDLPRMAMIKDGGRPLNVTVDVPAGQPNAVALALKLHVMHPRPRDALAVKLTSPAGKSVDLTADQLAKLGGGEVAIDLPAFVGAPASGKWTLAIADKDKKPADRGMLHMASVVVTIEGAGPAGYVKPPHYEDMTSLELKKLAQLHNAFMMPEHLKHHSAWHEVNGPGGTRGPGSGELFLLFHHQMMKEFADYCAQHGAPDLVPMPIWDPTKRIPPEIKNPKAKRVTDNPKIPLPTWLTIEGGDTVAPGEIPGIKGLKDVKTLDDLGRLLGTSGYHASAHNGIGGTMATFGSPQDPVFFGWHGHLDDIMMQWIYKTENGQRWLQNNGDKLDHFQVPAKIATAVDRQIRRGVDMDQPMDFTDAEWRRAHKKKPLEA
jgi:subtilisin-like proprotein convertase family protein